MADDRRRIPHPRRFQLISSWAAGALALGVVLTVQSSGAAQTNTEGRPADEMLKQSVIGRILDARASFFADIKIDIISGDALLTGRVATIQDKARATALVRSVPGVQTVINEIGVGTVDDLKRISGDFLLERLIRKEMRTAFGDQIPHLAWRASSGVVYVFGRVKSEWERNRTLAVVKQAPGVVRVVDYLKTAEKNG